MSPDIASKISQKCQHVHSKKRNLPRDFKDRNMFDEAQHMVMEELLPFWSGFLRINNTDNVNELKGITIVFKVVVTLFKPCKADTYKAVFFWSLENIFVENNHHKAVNTTSFYSHYNYIFLRVRVNLLYFFRPFK